MGKPYCPPPAKDVALVCMLAPVEPFTVNNGVSADCDIQSGEVTAGDTWTFTWSPTSTNEDVQFCFPDPVVDNDDGSYSLTGTIVGEDGALMVDWPVAGLSDTDGVAILDGSFTLNGVCYDLPIALCSGGDDEITIDDAVEAIEVVKTFAAGAAATYSDCITGEPLDVTGWAPCPPGYQAPATGDAACASCLDEPEPEDPYLCTLTNCPDLCVNGSTYINGRPPASNPWSWGPYAADNLNDFEAALEAAGYTVTRFGEKHQICPPFGAFGEDPDAPLSNGITDDGQPVVEPNIDPDFVAAGDCAIHTLGCNDDRRDDLLEDILEELQEEPPAQLDVEHGEPFCNEALDVYEFDVTVYTDGIQTLQYNVITDVPCAEEAPDIEAAVECRNGTRHVVFYSIAEDAEPLQVSAIDTGEECPAPCCPTPECVKWQSVHIQLDNTGTRFSEATEFNITNTDGSVTTFTVGPVAGWSDQVSGIAAAMDAAYAGTYDPRCTILPNGCGGLLPPPSDAPAQPGIFARYINGVHCPTDLVIPIKAEAVRPDGKVVTLPFYAIKGPEYRGQQCRNCDGPPGPLTFADGTEVPAADLPVCVFSCAEQIPEPPLSECQFDVVPGNWCDIVSSGDPEIEDEVVQSEIFITVATCSSEQTISYAVATEDGGLEPYEPVGSVADCETGEEPFVEPPPCPEGLTPEQVCVPGDFKFFMDNSLWDDGVAPPANHLQNGNGYVIALFDANGAELSRSGPLADPYFNSLLKAPFGDCVMVPVCANHTSPKGCAPGHVANYETFIADIPQAGYDAATYPGDVQNNVANPPQDEVWATAWAVSCPGCGEAPAYVEIVDSTDEAWIGVRKNLIVWQAPDQIMFRSVDPCGGVYWQDCNGNPVTAPAGAKCAGPCPTAAQLETNSLLEQLLECMCAPCPEPSECPALDVGDATYTGDQTVVEFPAEACQGDRGALPDFAVPVSFGPKDALAQCLLDADPSTVIRIRWNFDHQPDPSDSHSGFGVSAVLAGGAATAVALSDQVGADIGPATPHNGPRLDHWADFDVPLSDLLAGFTLQTSGFGTVNEGLCETIHSQSVELSPADVNLAAICDC